MSESVVPKLALSPQEFASSVGIGLSRTYELLASGELESIKIGKLRRIPMASAERFIQERRTSGDAA